MPKSKKAAASAGLEGRFFHTFNAEKKLSHQGHVLKKISDEYYLVEFFSWMTGESTYQQLVPLRKMTDWWFYETAEEMRHSSDEGPASRKRDTRERTDTN